MIPNLQLNKEAEYIGEIQENRVGIDTNNINFITSLLTSNLYSNPIESFLRETISNARDSHIEACIKKPILLLIESNGKSKQWGYDSFTLSVRDYGTGVSPERFDKIYKNIGSSTKRESNDYIGMFGIGRFAALSCADTAAINSYYNGTKYSYIMYKNGNGINIDKIGEESNNYENGLEVIVEIDTTDKELSNSIKKLILFENLWIELKSGSNSYTLENAVEQFNRKKVLHYNTFSYCDLIYYDNYFKIGQVLYPINKEKLKEAKVDTLNTKGLLINLPIGKVDITPNRENLQYTNATLEIIKEKIAETKKELQEIFTKTINKDYSIYQLYNILCDHTYYINIPPYMDESKCLSIVATDITLADCSTTINNKKLPKDFIDFLRCISSFIIPEDCIYKTKGGREICFNRILDGTTAFYSKEDKTTSSVTLNFFVKEDRYLILAYNKTEAFFDSIKDRIKKSWAYKQNNINYDVDACVEFLKEVLVPTKISNSAVPDDFKKKVSTPSMSNNAVTVRHYQHGTYGMYSLSNILSFNSPILYSTNTQEDSYIRELSKALHDIHIITLKQKDLACVQNKKKFVPLETFITSKNKFFTKLATASVIKKSYIGCENISEIPIYLKYRKYYSKYLRILSYVFSDSFLNSVIERYIKNDWLIHSDIEQFALTKQDKELWRIYNKYVFNPNLLAKYFMRFKHKDLLTNSKIKL